MAAASQAGLGRSDEERVFVVGGAGARPGRTLTEAGAQRVEQGAEADHEGGALAGRHGDRMLDGAHRLFEAADGVAEEAIDPLHLCRGERRSLGRVLTDGVQAGEQRRQFALDLIGQPAETRGEHPGGNEHGNLDDCRREGRDGNDAEKDGAPVVNAFSRRAC